jgi:hypothetical protein
MGCGPLCESRPRTQAEVFGALEGRVVFPTADAFDGARGGRPFVKSIWGPNETIVAVRPMREWALHCLVDLAGNDASLEELRAFCEKRGIPGRRKRYWGISTWYAPLQPHVLMEY